MKELVLSAKYNIQKCGSGLIVKSSQFHNNEEISTLYIYSRSQVRAFDFALGASKVYNYRVKGKKSMRIGASFSNPINRIVHIKTLKQNWQK